MFIEDAWKKNPEFIINTIKKLCHVREEYGDTLEFKNLHKGVLEFQKLGHVSTFINVSDFAIRTSYSGENFETSPLSIQWMKEMTNAIGPQYIFQFIAQRNKQLDKFLAEYEKKYNAETKEIVTKLGLIKEETPENE